MPRSSPHDDYLPTASLQTLKLRARALAWMRRFFESHGYWEVETPILSHDIVVDAYLEPFTIGSGSTDNCTETPARQEPESRLFLQTSPEFGMKRLLSAGAEAIYQITRVFRQGERGRLHNPEFTMVEWYRVGDTHHDQMNFVEELVSEFFQQIPALISPAESEHAPGVMAENAGRKHLEAQSSQIEKALPRPFERLSYDEAFARYAGTKVLSLTTSQLEDLARRHEIVPPPGLDREDRDGWLNLLLAELVEPHLGKDRPTFLYHYPASQAALARIAASDGQDGPTVAERFELYVQGIELCNGYHELTDPQELRERMRGQAALRAAEGRPKLPQHNRLLDAMEAGLPPSAGVALGFDRLLMLAIGSTSIDEVIAFPFDRA